MGGDHELLADAVARRPALARHVHVEPDGRYDRLRLTLRHGQTEVVWGDGYTRVHGELWRCEGFIDLDELMSTLDLLLTLDAFDGRVGRIELDGECLVRLSPTWTEYAPRSRPWRRIREPALRIEYAQAAWAAGIDPATRVGHSDTLVIEGVREELERLQAGRWLEGGREVPVEWLSAAEAAAVAERFVG
jgi:hypothetical protein